MLATNVLCMKKRKKRSYCVSNVSDYRGKYRDKRGTSGVTMMHITEDTPPDMLAGAMDLRVQLPNGRLVKMSVERSTPMMDVLVQITTAHHLQLSGYVIEAMGMTSSSEHSDKVLPYKPNTPIGTLDTQHVRVVPKTRTLPTHRNVAPGYQPFESTFRLKVHLPRKQLFVSRVSMNVLLEDVMRKVCDEKNLDPLKYEFRHPDNLDEVLDPKLTLSDYQITEIYVVSKGSSRLSQAFSAGDIMALRKDEERTKQGRSSGGVFNLIFKRGKTSNGSGSVSSENRSISPTHSDDSRSLTPPAVQQQIIKESAEKPKVPLRKRRPAPKPPQIKEEQTKKTETGLTICHSRNSSDSSGYHEASVLSDNVNTTLPRRPQTMVEGQLSGEHSRSTGNLASMSSHSKSTSSLAFTGRKKKAPPPPPVPRSSSVEKASPVVASPVDKQDLPSAPARVAPPVPKPRTKVRVDLRTRPAVGVEDYRLGRGSLQLSAKGARLQSRSSLDLRSAMHDGVWASSSSGRTAELSPIGGSSKLGGSSIMPRKVVADEVVNSPTQNLDAKGRLELNSGEAGRGTGVESTSCSRAALQKDDSSTLASNNQTGDVMGESSKPSAETTKSAKAVEEDARLCFSDQNEDLRLEISSFNLKSTDDGNSLMEYEQGDQTQNVISDGQNLRPTPSLRTKDFTGSTPAAGSTLGPAPFVSTGGDQIKNWLEQPEVAEGRTLENRSKDADRMSTLSSSKGHGSKMTEKDLQGKAFEVSLPNNLSTTNSKFNVDTEGKPLMHLIDDKVSNSTTTLDDVEVKPLVGSTFTSKSNVEPKDEPQMDERVSKSTTVMDDAEVKLVLGSNIDSKSKQETEELEQSSIGRAPADRSAQIEGKPEIAPTNDTRGDGSTLGSRNQMILGDDERNLESGSTGGASGDVSLKSTKGMKHAANSKLITIDDGKEFADNHKRSTTGDVTGDAKPKTITAMEDTASYQHSKSNLTGEDAEKGLAGDDERRFHSNPSRSDARKFDSSTTGSVSGDVESKTVTPMADDTSYQDSKSKLTGEEAGKRLAGDDGRRFDLNPSRCVSSKPVGDAVAALDSRYNSLTENDVHRLELTSTGKTLKPNLTTEDARKRLAGDDGRRFDSYPSGDQEIATEYAAAAIRSKSKLVTEDVGHRLELTPTEKLLTDVSTPNPRPKLKEIEDERRLDPNCQADSVLVPITRIEGKITNDSKDSTSKLIAGDDRRSFESVNSKGVSSKPIVDCAEASAEGASTLKSDGAKADNVVEAISTLDDLLDQYDDHEAKDQRSQNDSYRKALENIHVDLFSGRTKKLALPIFSRSADIEDDMSDINVELFENRKYSGLGKEASTSSLRSVDSIPGWHSFNLAKWRNVDDISAVSGDLHGRWVVGDAEAESADQEQSANAYSPPESIASSLATTLSSNIETDINLSKESSEIVENDPVKEPTPVEEDVKDLETEWEYRLPSPPTAFRDSSPTDMQESEEKYKIDDSVVTSPELFEKLQLVQEAQSDVTDDKSIYNKLSLEHLEKRKSLVYNRELATSLKCKDEESVSSKRSSIIGELEEVLAKSTTTLTRRQDNFHHAPVDSALPNFKITTYDMPKKKIDIFEDDSVRSNRGLSRSGTFEDADVVYKKVDVEDKFRSPSKSGSFEENAKKPSLEEELSKDDVVYRKPSLQKALSRNEDDGVVFMKPNFEEGSKKNDDVVFRKPSIEDGFKVNRYRAKTLSRMENGRSESFSAKVGWVPANPVKRSKSQVAINQYKDVEETAERTNGTLSKSNSLYDVSGLQSLEVMRSIQTKLNTPRNSTEQLDKNETYEVDSKQPEVQKPAEQQQVQLRQTKTYQYRGPPSINLGTWSERPKSQISLKEDTDYKFAKKQTTNVSVSGSQRISAQSPGNVVIKIGGEEDGSFLRRKPLGNVNKVESRPHSVSFDISRVPIVRSVELKKPFKDMQLGNTSITQICHVEPKSLNGFYHSNETPNKRPLPVVKGFKDYSTNTNVPFSQCNLRRTESNKVTSKKVETSGDPRGMLLDAIRNFGGKKGLRSTKAV